MACLLGLAMSSEDACPVLARLGGYDLLEMLSRGGMGIVYRARGHAPEREVALKALPGAELLSREARQRFKTEAEAMARLEHPGILPVHEIGEDDGAPFFTMKLAVGGTLAARVSGYSGRWRAIAELLAGIAEAVHYAHQRGVLHRDLKPGNILFDEEGRALVSDFGLAKLLDDGLDLTRSLALMGTPNYLAPELTRGAKGAATTACDVWSLGVILYELLAGQPPFRGVNLAAVLRQLNEDEPPALPRPVPRDLRTITLKALRKSCSERYASAGDLAGDLRRWLAGEPILAQQPPLLRSACALARRHPAIAALSILLTSVLILASFLLVRANRELSSALMTAKSARQESDTRLKNALVAEALALLRSQDLGAREEVLKIIRQLVEGGQRGLETRTLAARALAAFGARKVESLPSGFAKGSSTVAFALDAALYARGTGSESAAFQIRPTTAGAAPRLVSTSAPANNFRFSRDGQWLAVLCRDSLLHVHRVSGPDAAVFIIRRARQTWNVILDFHPDSSHWVYSDGGARLRRHEAGTETADDDRIVFTAPAAVLGVSFSPDGSRLCVRWEGGWGVVGASDGRLLWQREEASTLDWPVWHPSGASVGNGIADPHQLLLADADTGARLTSFYGHQGDVVHALFHPVEPLLFTIAWDRQLIVWDALGGLALAHHPAMARGLGISADGTRLGFSPEYLGTAIFEFTPSRVWRQWLAPASIGREVTGLDLSPDDRWLVTNSDGTARLWEVAARRHLGDLSLAWEHASGLSYWLDGHALAHGLMTTEGARLNLRLKVDDPAFQPEIAEILPLPGGPLSRASDGRGILLHHPRDGSASVLARDGGVRLKIPAWGQPVVLDISPDDRWVACENVSHNGYEVRRLADGKIVLTLDVKRWARMRFSPDSRALVTAGAREVVVHETGSWRELARWPVDVSFDGVGWAAFSPDGRHLAALQAEGTLAVHETEMWKPLVHLRPPGPVTQLSGVKRMTWTADSRRLLVLSQGHRLSEWDMQALREELEKLGLGW